LQWALWDDFDVVSAEMYGYWNASAPIKIADGKEVFATTWVRHGHGALIAIGSWNPTTVNLTLADLTVDWSSMGLTPASTALEVPAVPGFNDPNASAAIARASCGEASMKGWVCPVSGNKGWVLRLRAKNSQ
jgi:hypothetical protein